MSREFNEGLVSEINMMRTNPKRYANKVLKYCDYFKGKDLRIPGSIPIKTQEGAEAYKDAADFLIQQSRIEPFEASKGLCKIAEEFLKEVQRCDPNDLASINMEEIIAKQGSFSGSFSRAIDFGGETPEQVLVNLIVCDGDSNRSQRGSLFSTELKKVGVANGKHDVFRHCTVILSCTQFDNTVDSDDRELFAENGDKEEEPKESEDGKILKPRKVVIRDVNNQGNDQGVQDSDKLLPPGCVSINKQEKIVVEGGKKNKIIKVTRKMKDGTKEVETIRESVNE